MLSLQFKNPTLLKMNPLSRIVTFQTRLFFKGLSTKSEIEELKYENPSTLFSNILLNTEIPAPITNLSRDTRYPRKLWTEDFDPRLHKLQLFLPQEYETAEGRYKDMLYTYRKLLREARDFFDPRARLYLTTEIKSEFRRYQNASKYTPERINDRRRQARKVARKLYKANQLDERAALSVLSYTYGRTGSLKWELLHPILHPMNIITKTYQPGYPLHIELHPTLEMLLRAQKFNKVSDPDPNIKSIRKQYNWVRLRYKHQLNKVQPPLPYFLIEELEQRADIDYLINNWKNNDPIGIFNHYAIYTAHRPDRFSSDSNQNIPLEVQKQSEEKTIRRKNFIPSSHPNFSSNDDSQSSTVKYFNKLPTEIDIPYLRKISRFYQKLLAGMPIIDQAGHVFYSKRSLLSFVKGKNPIVDDFPLRKAAKRHPIEPLDIEKILNEPI